MVIGTRNEVSHASPSEIAKYSGLSLVGALLLFGLYAGCTRAFAYLQAVPIVGPLLISKILAMVFLTLFSMVVFSSAITSFTTLFGAKDLPFLLQSPISFRQVFLFKAFQTFVFASWMVAVSMVPFVAAYGQVKSVPALFYATVTGLSIPFLVCASGLGIFAVLLLMGLFPNSKLRDILLILGVLLAGGLTLFFRFLQPERLVRADVLNEAIQYIAYIQAPTAVYWPSWWIAASLDSFTGRQWKDLAFYSALLIGSALIVVQSLLFTAESLYYRGWVGAQEARLRPPAQELRLEKLGRWSAFLPYYSRVLLTKDVKIFFRDVSQWSQLFLLGSLVAVYLFSIDRLPLDTPYLKSLISFLNIGFAGFVLASIALRFVFPAVSLEGQSVWVVRTSPLPVWQWLLSQFALYSLPLVILGGGLVWWSCRLLEADAFVLTLSTATMVVVAVTLTALGTGLGAAFPRFHVENVAQIETSPGGLLFLTASLFYIGLVLALEAMPMQMYFRWKMRGAQAWDSELLFVSFASLLLVSAIAAGGALWWGKKSLENYED